jgi:hypothetical protein
MSTIPVHWMHWDFREAWPLLTILAKFYILFLMASSVYISYLLIRTIFDLRALFKHGATTPALAVRRLFELGGRLENLRQFTTMLFIVFGVFLANESFNTIRGIQLSVMSLSAARFDIFGPLIEFAFAALTVLAVLHGLQWIVAARFRATQALHWFNAPTPNH